MFSLLLTARVPVEEPSIWPYQLLGLGCVAVLVIVPILVIRSMRRGDRGDRDTEGLYRGITGIAPVGDPPVGYVQLTFHTYSGFLVYVEQRKHDLVLPVDQARVLLKRFLKHNLTWGFFVYGGVFVPILSLLEYRSQSKRIARAR